MYIWWAPSNWLKARRRGQWLEMIEFWGKWTLSIVFVINQVILAFSVNINSTIVWPNATYWPEDFISVDLRLDLEEGLIMYTIVCFLMQFVQTYMLHSHRRCSAMDQLPDDAESAAQAFGADNLAMAIAHVKTDAKTAASKLSTKRKSGHTDLSAESTEQDDKFKYALMNHRFVSTSGYIRITLLGKCIGLFLLGGALICLVVGTFLIIQQYSFEGIPVLIMGEFASRSFSFWQMAGTK